MGTQILHTSTLSVNKAINAVKLIMHSVRFPGETVPLGVFMWFLLLCLTLCSLFVKLPAVKGEGWRCGQQGGVVMLN